MKHLAFDLGKVLFDFDYAIALNRIKARIGVSVETIIEELFKNNFALDFEKGLLSPQDFYIKFKREFISSVSYDEFVDIWSDIFTPKKDVIELIENLRPAYPLYLISNINKLHFEYLNRKHMEVFALFDKLILSYKLKSVKPETKIYSELIKISGAEYRDITYIDDREDLIQEAAKLNLNCIRFDNFEQLKKDLDKSGIYIPGDNEAETLNQLHKKVASYHDTLLIGLGNTLRGDDGAGARIISQLEDKISLKTLNAGVSLENYLGKIAKINPGCIIMFDAASFEGEERFSLFGPKDIQNISLSLTHNSSLKLASEYLQKEIGSDILIFAVRSQHQVFGKEMSVQTTQACEIIENFFLRNFSPSISKTILGLKT
ncbi:MAG: HAD hydrolase-like protein [Candidatus Omnitrophica bacterium]|nr:HAD hydrolase-like protein [Candidatus Omnitrophota bacterium]